jgi:hypothetical protein
MRNRRTNDERFHKLRRAARIGQPCGVATCPVDPNLTNTRFPGIPSYRSRDPLGIVGVVSSHSTSFVPPRYSTEILQ